MPDKTTGATRLASWRERQGWTLHTLATSIGVHRSLVGRWEQGLAVPGAANAVVLAELTAGYVSPADWMAHDDGARMKRAREARP